MKKRAMQEYKLTPQELRIGNVIELYGRCYQIMSVITAFGDIPEVELYPTDDDNANTHPFITPRIASLPKCRPILFNRQWAEAFGFDVEYDGPKNGLPNIEFIKKSETRQFPNFLVIHNTDYSRLEAGFQYYEMNHIFQYIHQLQNIFYWANEQKELDLVENWRELVERKEV